MWVLLISYKDEKADNGNGNGLGLGRVRLVTQRVERSAVPVATLELIDCPNAGETPAPQRGTQVDRRTKNKEQRPPSRPEPIEDRRTKTEVGWLGWMPRQRFLRGRLSFGAWGRGSALMHRSRYFINPAIWRLIDAAREKSRRKVSSSKYSRRRAKWSWARTSPTDAFALPRKSMKSLSVLLSNPSAMFDTTETPARRI